MCNCYIIPKICVVVSACLLGRNCKFNGSNNYNPNLIEFLKDKDTIEICPELLAGLPTPRAPAKLIYGRVTENNGNGVHLQYMQGVERALEKLKNEKIDLVILQSHSPTCGVNQIYDGTFTGKKLMGVEFSLKH
ncbi:MAG: DUF523 domain-containing protein [Pasteurellaceae bacterium]|nr:DUF523 domain-containing protein [Pasteurellaceae bacterium]